MTLIFLSICHYRLSHFLILAKLSSIFCPLKNKAIPFSEYKLKVSETKGKNMLLFLKAMNVLFNQIT